MREDLKVLRRRLEEIERRGGVGVLSLAIGGGGGGSGGMTTMSLNLDSSKNRDREWEFFEGLFRLNDDGDDKDVEVHGHRGTWWWSLLHAEQRVWTIFVRRILDYIVGEHATRMARGGGSSPR